MATGIRLLPAALVSTYLWYLIWKGVKWLTTFGFALTNSV